MTNDVYSEILLSIEADRVVIFCGAGLSMANPSNLPSAKALANEIYDKFEEVTGKKLDSTLKDDLELLAKYFIDDRRYQDFINVLIPWQKFRDNPNSGHESIADFLECNAVELVVSTNYDTFIEDAARELGDKNFRANIDGLGSEIGTNHKPLLKIHGCCLLDNYNTVWNKEQILNGTLRTRIDNSKKFLTVKLHEKHLIFIGFWSDWSYLNDVLTDCISKVEPQLVIVVNPDEYSELEKKAPDLMSWAKKTNFYHEQVSGDYFLQELRRKHNIQFLKKLVNNSKAAYEKKFGIISTSILVDDRLSVKDSYNLKRYFCGIPNSKPVKIKRPNANQELIGIYHIYLIEKGAVLEEIFYKINGHIVRMINGAGKLISSLKKEFERDNYFGADFTLCIGADDDITPTNIIRTSSIGTIIRIRDTSHWITHADINSELRI